MFAFLALDFETTGSVPGYACEPWQLGALAVPASGDLAQARALDTWLHIDLARPFNRHAPGRHAQVREALADAPTLPDVWPSLAPYAETGPVVAHNIGTERTLLRAAVPLHTPRLWIDTLVLARLAWPDAPSGALETLIPYLGLQPQLEALMPGRAPHDALYDATACALLLLHLLSEPAWQRLTPQELAYLRTP